MSVTNQLEIDIKASSEKAISKLDTLIAKLKEVDSALDSLNPQKLEQISNSLKGLNSTKIRPSNSGGNSITTETKAAAAQAQKTRRIFDLLSASTNRTNKGILNFKSSMLKMAAAWGTFYAAMYPVIRLFKFFGSKVKDSMDYVETYNYFLVTMNKLGHDSGEEYLDGFMSEIKDLNKKMTSFTIGKNGELFESGQKSLGLDPNLVMQFQARVGAVTNSVGLLGKTSVAAQKALTMLSSDLSSLTNTDLQSVMTNLQSGLIGQSRALYKYGIDITQATLKTYAYQNGITKAVSAMTQSEKMQLRLLAILDQSKVAWGDQANTINSVANQYRIMKQQISNLGRVIGNLFLPIIQTVLPYINAFIIALRKILTLLGFNLYGSNWLKDLNTGISSGNFDGLADEVDDFSDSLDDATGSAKKLKQAVMGFDELNIINDQSNSGGGSGSGGGGFDLSGAIDDALGEYQRVWDEAFNNMTNKAEELANRIMKYIEARDFFGLGRWFADSMTHILRGINWERVFEGAKAFGTGLADFLNGLISPELFYEVGKTIANSINTALIFAFSFGKEFDFKNLGIAIGNYINGFFENFDFVLLAETLNTWVDGLEDAIIGAITTIKWNKVFRGITDFLTHLDFDTIMVAVGALTISKVSKILMSDIVRNAILKKIATKLTGASLPSALRVTGGLIMTVKGLTMIFDGLQEQDWWEAVGGSLITTGGAFILTKGNIYVAIGTLVFTIGAIAWKWLETPDESGSIGLIKLFKSIKLPGGKGLDWEGNEVKYTTNLHVMIKEIRWNFVNAIHNLHQKIDEIKETIKTAWGDFKLDVKFAVASMKGAVEEKWIEFTTWWDETIVAWWDNNVAPWFTKKKWLNLTNGMKLGLEEKWGEFTEWWQDTGIPDWWDDNVAPWFTKETWQELGQGIKDGLTTKWDEFTEWWRDTGIPDWWDKYVAPIFTKENWTFSGIKEGLSAAFEAAINGIKKLWNTFADWINDKLTWTIEPVTVMGETIFEGASINLGKLPKFNIPAYRIGGFPEDGLFFANHNEMVGQFSNGQTAVANNEQIVEGIRYGVQAAVNEALAPYLRDIANNTSATASNTEDIKNKPTQTFSDRDVARANIRGTRSMGLTLRTT